MLLVADKVTSVAPARPTLEIGITGAGKGVCVYKQTPKGAHSLVITRNFWFCILSPGKDHCICSANITGVHTGQLRCDA